MAWVVLVVAGLLEVVWASLLPRTQGFTRLLPTLGFLVSLAASMLLLAHATRTLPVGTAYAVWVGIGAVGTVAVAAITGAEQLSPLRAGLIALLVLAIAGLKLSSPA